VSIISLISNAAGFAFRPHLVGDPANRGPGPAADIEPAQTGAEPHLLQTARVDLRHVGKTVDKVEKFDEVTRVVRMVGLGEFSDLTQGILGYEIKKV
jgi:hypothetical protein